jgi:hypothetical protein
MNTVIQPKVKVALLQGEIVNITIGRAAWEACSSTWNLGTNSAFALGPRKTTEYLHRVGRSQDVPNANWLLVSSPALNTQAPTLVPICAVVFYFYFSFLSFFPSNYFYKYCCMHMIWISTKPCKTPAVGMNKYA